MDPSAHLVYQRPFNPDGWQYQALTRLGIAIRETPVLAIEHEAGSLTALLLADGSRAHPTALFARVPFLPSSDLAQQLGCQLTEQQLIQTTDFGETNVSGVFAAGDAMTLFRQVAIAVANGGKAGAWINRELIADDLRHRLDSVMESV